MDFLSILADSSIRLTVPLLLATLGELISQRAGIMNVGLEGMMAAGAFGGIVAALMGFGIPAAILCAVIAGCSVGLLMALGTVRLGGNQILVGFALFILVPGFATFMMVQIGLASSLPALPVLSVPFLSGIPFIGGPLFSQNIFYYMAIVLSVLAWIMLSHSRFGLLLAAVGHDPAKAASKGIPPQRIQVIALLLCGALAGLGGAALSLGAVGTYTPNIIGGRGFIVIAIVILGRWTIGGAIAGALLMGTLEAIKLSLPQFSDMPVQLLGALPWVVVIIMLVLSSRSMSNGPRSLVR